MKIYDISMLIHDGMMIYKNREENKPQLELVKSFDTDGINESSIKMNLHSGTHIDAKFHMNKFGETSEKFDLSRLVTKCKVIDLTQLKFKISREDLSKFEINKDDFILLKTKNSFSEVFLFDYIYLDESGAEYLKELSISGVGIDALGIERNQPNHITHKKLMDKDIIILEGLVLKDVPAGEYFLCALPLKIEGADGAPARVILIDDFRLHL
ncbi:MAG: cyclase family protein [Bacillota bacterium]